MGYFKPLRRRFGVATLVLACVFAVGWIRTIAIEDEIRILAFGLINEVHTKNGYMGWCVFFQQLPPEDAELPLGWESIRDIVPYKQAAIWEVMPYWIGHQEVARQFDQYGFALHIAPELGKTKAFALIVPYWSIVIPLTLLSAFLTLSKIGNPKPQAEPDPKA